MHELDPVTRSWVMEYHTRKMFPGMSHEQYLDEPMEAIQWMAQIDRVLGRDRSPAEPTK